MKKILAVAVVLLMAASAQAAYYDAINFNISDGGSGAVSGTQTTPNGFGANWVNVTGYAKYFNSPVATKTSNGVSIAGLTLGFYDADVWQGSGGGGGRIDAIGGQAAGSLNYSCIYTTGSLRIDNLGVIPFTSYDVMLLMNNSWVKADATTVDGSPTGGWGFYTHPRNTTDFVQAIQILSTNPADAGPSVPEPATMSLLALGGLATVIRRRSRR